MELGQHLVGLAQNNNGFLAWNRFPESTPSFDKESFNGSGSKMENVINYLSIFCWQGLRLGIASHEWGFGVKVSDLTRLPF